MREISKEKNVYPFIPMITLPCLWRPYPVLKHSFNGGKRAGGEYATWGQNMQCKKCKKKCKKNAKNASCKGFPL